MGNKPTVKKKSRGKNIAETLDPNNAPDDAKVRALRRTLLIKKLDTGRCTSAQELEERFQNLFEVCFQNNFIPTVEALALCSGWDRRTLWDIERGDTHKGDGMSDVIKKAKDMISTLEAELARDGEINSTVYIFRAKNYYGMVDKQEVQVSASSSVNEPMNADAIINNVPQLKDKNVEVINGEISE